MNKNRVGEVKVDLVKTSLRTLGLQTKFFPLRTSTVASRSYAPILPPGVMFLACLPLSVLQGPNKLRASLHLGYCRDLLHWISFFLCG